LASANSYDVPAHPLQTSIDVPSLAPNAEITVFPWKEPAELKERTINRVRNFLVAHPDARRCAINPITFPLGSVEFSDYTQWPSRRNSLMLSVSCRSAIVRDEICYRLLVGNSRDIAPIATQCGAFGATS
jgi:hypothetical protein